MERTFTAEFSIGDTVYHTACGTKGIIIAYNVDKREVMYRVDYGIRDGVRIEHKHCISKDKVL